MLDRLYTSFDALSTEHNIFKVETIGDACNYCVAACCSVLQCVAACCSVLQCVAVCCSLYTSFDALSIEHNIFRVEVIGDACKQCVAACCSVLQRVAVCYRVLQCVAVCCSLYTSFYALSTEHNIFTIGDACNYCVAVCCSVLQRVAACCRMNVRFK